MDVAGRVAIIFDLRVDELGNFGRAGLLGAIVFGLLMTSLAGFIVANRSALTSFVIGKMFLVVALVLAAIPSMVAVFLLYVFILIALGHLEQ